MNDLFYKAGYSIEEVEKLVKSTPDFKGDFLKDSKTGSEFFKLTNSLLLKLPRKPNRNDSQSRAAHELLNSGRNIREKFLALHVRHLYSIITDDFKKSVGAYDLPYEAAKIVEGLTPTREQVADELELIQKEKEGIEIDQGLFFSYVLADEKAGRHLCHTMLLPSDEAKEKLSFLQEKGSIDLGMASIETKNSISWVTMKNGKFLNAEDTHTLKSVETAVELAIMDTNTIVAVLRGDTIDHPKYAGKRVFCSGINLSHLYHGKIPYLWYMKRDLGFLHKIFRGLAIPGKPVDDVYGTTIEKLWIAQVDSFAIGSGCQFLLPTDYVVAADDAFLTLPASKEGIIPGVADLRLHRFVGDRMARQLIMMARRLECASPEGHLICDEVVPSDQIEATIIDAAKKLTNSGFVAVAANRKAFRVALEPLDLFRQYMAVYAREQAYCHFSKELIDNLERQTIAVKE